MVMDTLVALVGAEAFRPVLFTLIILSALLSIGLMSHVQDVRDKRRRQRRAAEEEARYQASELVRQQARARWQERLNAAPEFRFVSNTITGQVRIQKLERSYYTVAGEFDTVEQAAHEPLPYFSYASGKTFASIGEAQDFLDAEEAQAIINRSWTLFEARQ